MGFHISFDLVVVVGNSSGGVVFSVVGASVVCVGAGVGVGCYVFDIMFFAACFALSNSTSPLNLNLSIRFKALSSGVIVLLGLRYSN